MPVIQTSTIYESKQLRSVTGPAIRPGGLALTGRAMDFCHFPSEARLLDVGCGVGATVSYLRSRFQMNACGLDISAPLLEEGKSGDDALPLLRARAEHLPFGMGSMDGIICECVLSLISEPDRALREFYRVLSPNGKLILSDIYLRGPRINDRFTWEAYYSRTESVVDCLQGFPPSCPVMELLSEAGLAVLLWEDHTPLLMELAARLVLAGGTIDAFRQDMEKTGCSGGSQAVLQMDRPGYYLLVAGKK
jgi:SAM-dependent methyltransferase